MLRNTQGPGLLICAMSHVFFDEKKASMLQLLSVKDFAPSIPTCAQIVQSKYLHSGLDISKTQLVVLDQLKMAILARGSVMPGFCTLISNLLTIYSPSESRASWSRSWLAEYRESLPKLNFASPQSN
jgi:hypothetical protein